MIEPALSAYPNLFERLHRTITPERAFATFKTIADTYAPTLTVRYTRAPIVGHLLNQAKQEGISGDNLTFHGNYRGSGGVGLSFGAQARKPVWSMAHLDIISFLTGAVQPQVAKIDADLATSVALRYRYALTPYCEARQTPGMRAALALQYSLQTGQLEEAAEGFLQTEAQGHFFVTDRPDLPLATRVVYKISAEWDRESGMIYGAIDNALGSAALVLAAQVLSHYPVEALIVLNDEEEGVVAAGPPAFARGSARLLNRTPPDQLPDLITVSDTHNEVIDPQNGALNQARFGQGALFAAFASHTRGGVTPPQLLSFQRQLAHFLGQQGISLQESGGYVGRSDCASAMLATPNVALLGLPGAYAHFVATPRAHISDLVNLAKTLTIYLLIAQNAKWRTQFLTYSYPDKFWPEDGSEK